MEAILISDCHYEPVIQNINEVIKAKVQHSNKTFFGNGQHKLSQSQCSKITKSEHES
jgi:hypothetical protein